MGTFIRLDFSLVGYAKLKSKRRRMSILVRDKQVIKDAPHVHPDLDIIMVNNDRKIIVNPMEDLDMDEKLAVLTDIINADPV